MSEPTPNESPLDDDEAASYNWNHPMCPNYMFSEVERNIIVACIQIVIDEYYFHPTDFACLFGSGAKPVFAKIIGKIKKNTDFDDEDGYHIGQAVLQVSSFPMRHNDEAEKQLETQFDLKMYQLFWFPSYIRNGFVLHKELQEERKQV